MLHCSDVFQIGHFVAVCQLTDGTLILRVERGDGVSVELAFHCADTVLLSNLARRVTVQNRHGCIINGLFVSGFIKLPGNKRFCRVERFEEIVNRCKSCILASARIEIHYPRVKRDCGIVARQSRAVLLIELRQVFRARGIKNIRKVAVVDVDPLLQILFLNPGDGVVVADHVTFPVYHVFGDFSYAASDFVRVHSATVDVVVQRSDFLCNGRLHRFSGCGLRPCRA